MPTPRLRVTLRNVVNRCKSRTEMGETNEICFREQQGFDHLLYSSYKGICRPRTPSQLFPILHCEPKIRSRLLWTYGGHWFCCDLLCSTLHECILWQATINKVCALRVMIMMKEDSFFCGGFDHKLLKLKHSIFLLYYYQCTKIA